MTPERQIWYNDTYLLHFTLEGLKVTLWAVEDVNGNDITSRVDRYDWTRFEEYISSRLEGQFCYFNEC